MNNRKFDIVVMGATGFTGKLVVEYLLDNYGVENEQFSWAIAGRSTKKLQKLKNSLSDIHTSSLAIPEIIADSLDKDSLDKMASNCRVIISTVGPYLKYGHLLLQSCVENGTHYCDLTGEVPFIKQSIDQFNQLAKKNNCRIIHSCGFDSVPSDIGVFLLQEEAKRRFGQICSKVSYYVHGMGGGFSGGTIDSGINVYQYVVDKPDLQKAIRDPYSLVPDHAKTKTLNSTSLRTVKWDRNVNRWICPFVMAGINTKIVRRSNGLMDNDYGDDFQYNEIYSFQRGIIGYLKALFMTISLGLTIFFMKYKFSLNILKKYFFPSPGEGPSYEERKNGFFKIHLVGYTDKNKQLSMFINGDSDPGYSATAKMITESALSIILNKQHIPTNAGVLTPATGIGKILAERLKNNGITFNLE